MMAGRKEDISDVLYHLYIGTVKQKKIKKIFSLLRVFSILWALNKLPADRDENAFTCCTDDASNEYEKLRG